MDPEMNMLPEAEMPPSPMQAVDDLVAAVLAAKGADMAMVDALPPLSEDMVTPELAEMLSGMGLMPADDVTEEDMFNEALAEDAEGIPCAECPDPAKCKAAGFCKMGMA
jgi:hypothetical protein